MADDLEFWTQDDVRRTRLAEICARHNLTAAECGVPGGVAEWQSRADGNDGPEAEKAAQLALPRLVHLVLNLMRHESGLDYTHETDPAKWPLAELTQTMSLRKRKLVKLPATAETQWRQRTAWKEMPAKENGWGNDKLVNTNPLNYDGIRNTTDAGPGWWYRMVFSAENRETVLSVLTFWNPDEAEPGRREELLDPAKNPRRALALDIAARCREVKPGDAPKRRRKSVAA